MTQHLIPNPGPYIATAATRNLLDQLDRLALRLPEIATAVQAVRSGDNQRLMSLVRQTQGGDSNAALVAIGALLPRLCKVIINRRPPNRWKPAVDEYLTLAYLTIIDVKPGDSSVYLADKLIARTRLRHERQLVPASFVPVSELDHTPDLSHGVEERVLARLELLAVADAVHAGQIRRDDISEVALAVVGRKPHRPRTETERQQLSRARRRLADNYPVELNEAA